MEHAHTSHSQVPRTSPHTSVHRDSIESCKSCKYVDSDSKGATHGVRMHGRCALELLTTGWFGWIHTACVACVTLPCVTFRACLRRTACIPVESVTSCLCTRVAVQVKRKVPVSATFWAHFPVFVVPWSVDFAALDVPLPIAQQAV